MVWGSVRIDCGLLLGNPLKDVEMGNNEMLQPMARLAKIPLISGAIAFHPADQQLLAVISLSFPFAWLVLIASNRYEAPFVPPCYNVVSNMEKLADFTLLC